MFEINFKSTYFLIKEALPHMKNRKDSNIIIMSSVSGYEPSNVIGFYSITKTMLVSMTKILAHELKPIPIRVNCIAPGVIKTGFSKMLWEGKEK